MGITYILLRKYKNCPRVKPIRRIIIHNNNNNNSFARSSFPLHSPGDSHRSLLVDGDRGYVQEINNMLYGQSQYWPFNFD